jgi:hypothetical protein
MDVRQLRDMPAIIEAGGVPVDNSVRLHGFAP